MRKKSLLLIIPLLVLIGTIVMPIKVDAADVYTNKFIANYRHWRGIVNPAAASVSYPTCSTASVTVPNIRVTTKNFDSGNNPFYVRLATGARGEGGTTQTFKKKIKNVSQKTTVLGTGSKSVTRSHSAQTIYMHMQYHDSPWLPSANEAKDKKNVTNKDGIKIIIVKARDSYAVTYNANGGTGVPGSQTKWCAESLTLSSTKPIRIGYTFNGWNTNALGTGTNYAPGGSYTGNAAVTLYAKWVPNTYTVKFDVNGGTGTMANQSFTYDEEKALPANAFTRTNHRFIGWNTKADGTGTAYTNGESVKNLTAAQNAEITLYAQWVVDAPILITESGEEVEKDSSGNYIFKNVRSTGRLRICKQVR